MNNTTKNYKPILNSNTNKQSEKSGKIRQNQIKQHATKMSQRKQKCKVKTHVKQEKYTRRSVLIPHKQLKTV